MVKIDKDDRIVKKQEKIVKKNKKRESWEKKHNWGVDTTCNDKTESKRKGERENGKSNNKHSDATRNSKTAGIGNK